MNSVSPSVNNWFLAPNPLLKEKENLAVPQGAIVLEEGEMFHVEPGGMLAYKNLTVETKRSISSVKDLFRKYILGGETFFINIYKAEKDGGWLTLEENQPNQIESFLLEPGAQGLAIRQGAYLASTSNVVLNTVFKGIKGYFKGKGFAVNVAKVEAGQKPGRVFFHSVNGTVKKYQLFADDKPTTFDNNMILAYSEGLESTLKRIGGFKTLFFSGEGFVTEFKGEGFVYVGSAMESDHNNNALLAALQAGGGEIGNWIGKTIFVASLGGIVYYGIPEQIKNEFFQVLLRLLVAYEKR